MGYVNRHSTMATFNDIEEVFHRLDWSILQNGWISLYWKKSILAKDLEWFEKENYKIVDFDCKLWTDIAEMHGQLKQKLNFPDYYGKNFDALNDCLSDIEINGTGQIVVFNHLDSIDIKTIQILLDVFADNSRKHILFGERLIVLAQVDSPDFKIDPVGSTTVSWNKQEWLDSKRR
jgi:RNAse (barnase) inhibitor barstar